MNIKQFFYSIKRKFKIAFASPIFPGCICIHIPEYYSNNDGRLIKVTKIESKRIYYEYYLTGVQTSMDIEMFNKTYIVRFDYVEVSWDRKKILDFEAEH